MSDRKMEVKVKTVLSKIALIIFISLFSLISIKGILWDNFHNISYVFVSLFALAWLALYGVIFWLTKRFSQFFERYYWHILIITTVLYMALQFFISYWLKFFPIYDMGSVYGGAVQWLTTGSFSDHYEYFGTFPNNLGAIIRMYQ